MNEDFTVELHVGLLGEGQAVHDQSRQHRGRPFPAGCTESSCCNDARFKVIGFMFEDHAAQSETKMRNVIFAIKITLDGGCDHTQTIADEEMLECYTHLMRGVDLLVFGRKTYQLMVPYWPDVAKKSF